MYRTILVPLDGSLWSEQALPVATTIARHAQAVVHLVHVHIPLLVVIPSAVSVFDTSADQQQREQEQSYLNSVADRLSEQGLRVITWLLEGAVAPVLQEYVAQHAIDLAVMTTHGRGALSQLWFGSVTDQLVRSLPTPILLLHPNIDAPAKAVLLSIRHILIPLDGSKLSEGIVDYALALGELTEAKYTLLNIVEQLPSAGRPELVTVALDDETLVAARHAAASYLDQVAADRCERAPHMHIVVKTGRPSDIIPAYAREHNVDLIAMATHGRSGFVRWYLGSVATTVMRSNSLPMLLYRPHNLPDECNDQRL